MTTAAATTAARGCACSAMRGCGWVEAMSVFSSSLKRIRPFSTAYWLSIFTVLLPAIQVVGHPCATSWYVEVVYGAFVVVGLGWANHVRQVSQGEFKFAQFVWNWSVDLFIIGFVTIAFFALTFFFRPAYQCYTARAEVTEVLSRVSGKRTEIADRAIRNKTLSGAGVETQISIEGRIRHATVTRDGVIAIASDDPVAVIFLVPALEDGQVRWDCDGYPQKYMPASCRADVFLSWLHKRP